MNRRWLSSSLIRKVGRKISMSRSLTPCSWQGVQVGQNRDRLTAIYVLLAFAYYSNYSSSATTNTLEVACKAGEKGGGMGGGGTFSASWGVSPSIPS